MRVHGRRISSATVQATLALALVCAATGAHADDVVAEPGVTVRGRVPSREIERREITAEEIRELPGTRGDALLAVQNLPGVARPAFGLGQFAVRASPPADSLVLLEGQPIAQPFHFYGLASVVATDLVDRVDFMPGNFSVRYGRASGGVIDIALRTPVRTRPVINVDVDVLDAGVYASLPLGRNATLALGVRRSYVDLWGPALSGLYGGGGFTRWPAFYDYQLALDWDATPRDALRVLVSGSDDQLVLGFNGPNPDDPSLRGQASTHLAYHGVQSRWQHRFAPGILHTFAPALVYALSDAQLGSEFGTRSESLTLSFRDEFEARLAPGVRGILGADIQVGGSDDRLRAPPVSTNGITDPSDPQSLVTYAAVRSAFNPAFYAELEYTPDPRVRVLAGVRLDDYSRSHALTVDPRVTVRVQVHPRLTLRAGAGLYSTPPRGYYTIPGFGNPELQPEHWLHATFAATVSIVPDLLELDGAFFIKHGSSVVVPSSVTSDQGAPERFANRGTGSVLGGEWLLRIRPSTRSPLFALVSYTLSRATTRDCDSCIDRTSDWDMPHILSATVGAHLPRNWEAGARFRFTSGIVEPVVTGALYDSDHDVARTLTDGTRTGRLPDFVQLDVRVAKRWRIGPVGLQLIVEVINATNAQNAESRIYSYDRRESRTVTGLPILPNIGVRVEY